MSYKTIEYPWSIHALPEQKNHKSLELSISYHFISIFDFIETQSFWCLSFYNNNIINDYRYHFCRENEISFNDIWFIFLITRQLSNLMMTMNLTTKRFWRISLNNFNVSIDIVAQNSTTKMFTVVNNLRCS